MSTAQPMDIQQAQVEWYRKNGRYPERICREYKGTGREYVAGDWSWNRRRPNTTPEFIEQQMSHDLHYKRKIHI